MTDADKVMHPQHFGTDPTDIQTRINLIIRIGIPDDFLVEIVALVEVCTLWVKDVRSHWTTLQFSKCRTMHAELYTFYCWISVITYFILYLCQARLDIIFSTCLSVRPSVRSSTSKLVNIFWKRVNRFWWHIGKSAAVISMKQDISKTDKF